MVNDAEDADNNAIAANPYAALEKWIARHAGAPTAPAETRLQETANEVKEVIDDLHALLERGTDEDFLQLKDLYRRSSVVTDSD